MKKYFLLTYPRVGSYALCEILRKYGCGNAKGFFYGDYSPESLLYKNYNYNSIVKEGSKNDLFGCKIHYVDKVDGNNLNIFNKLVGEKDSFFIILERKNKLKQAVSLYIARETGKFVHKKLDLSLPENYVHYDFNKLYNTYVHILNMKNKWDRWLEKNNREYITLYYEDDILQKPDIGAKKIMDYLNYNYTDIQIDDSLNNKIAFPNISKNFYEKFVIDLKNM